MEFNFYCVSFRFSQRSVQTSLSESKAVASAFVECLQYVVQLNQHNEILCQELLKDQLLPCICQILLSNGPAYASDALFLSVSKLLHSWGRSAESSLQRKLLHSFCSDMSVCLKKMAIRDTVDGFCKETDIQLVENTVNIDCSSSNTEKAMLKNVLSSQVDFITCLMEKRKPQGKVGFFFVCLFFLFSLHFLLYEVIDAFHNTCIVSII